MDENFTRGYCQLRSETPRVESRPPLGAAIGVDRTAPPRDKCNGIYLALIICGAGFLLPYNSFIVAVDYYQAKYPGTTIIFDMSLTYICVAFVGESSFLIIYVKATKNKCLGSHQFFFEK